MHNKGFKRATNFRETKAVNAKLPIKNVFSSKEQWQPSSCVRPEGAKQICAGQTFSTNIPCISTRVLTGSGLDGQDRYFQCLFSRANSRVPSLLPQVGLPRRVAANDIPAFRPIICTSDICSSNELDCGNPSFQRNSSSSLSGRFPLGPPGPVQVEISDCGSREDLRVSGMANKLSKVSANTNTPIGVPGDNMGYRSKQNIVIHREKKENRSGSKDDIEQETLHSKTGGKIARSVKFRQFCGSKRPPSLPVPTNISETIQTKPQNETEAATTGNGRSQMVDSRYPSRFTSTSTSIHSLPDNRRSGCRLGSPAKRNSDVGNVDRRTDEMALELERAVRSICVDSESISYTEGCSYSSPVRQSDTGLVHTERGRNSFPEFTQTDTQVVEADRREEHTLISSLPPGEVQLHSRSPIKGAKAIRVASIAHSNKPIISSLGKTRCRPVRVSRNSRGQQIRLSGLQRSLSTILKCLQSRLGLSAGMDISSTQSHSSGFGAAKQGKRSLYYHSTTLGKDLLVSGSEITSPGTTNNDRETFGMSNRYCNGPSSSASRPTDPSGLVSWRWGQQTCSWSERERQLLKTSWRQSTIQTYYPAIRRWFKWCDENRVNSYKPQLQQVARFLAYLHLQLHLAYNTILIHKSAIFTFCKINSEQDEEQLLVRQILKAIATAHPAKPKPPVWDAQVVLGWLSTPNDKITLFEVSRRTATILLLASGRRVHDLTLLRISDSHICISDDRIVLWPVFGSKTDSGQHRQSGWLLLKHPDPQICPVRWVKQLISLTAERRYREEGLNHLFITIIGKPRPASRTVIGGWLKSVLRESGVSATPGSFRSAVASASWVENHPIEDILARGNWKSEQTFQRFYCKEIERKTRGSQLLFNNFKPE